MVERWSVCKDVDVLGFAAPAQAQIFYGSIVGIVKDAQGARVPGAAVNKETNFTRETKAPGRA